MNAARVYIGLGITFTRRRRDGMALLLMGVRLIRSSQVLASFRRTHVLKLSLPRELHMLFPSHSTHSQAFLLIIMQHKRLARTKLFVTRWHCNDPKKRDDKWPVHCNALGWQSTRKLLEAVRATNSPAYCHNVFYQLIG